MQEIDFYLQKMTDELKLRGYSKKTIKAYLFCLKQYLCFSRMNPEILNIEAVKSFLLDKHDKNYSPQTINLFLNAIKFFYKEIIGNNKKINIHTIKRSLKLPVVLSRMEILRIVESIDNLKHKLLISLSYSAGLRISEAISLKVKDMSFENLTIHIKEAKGKKDRITIFSKKLKENLQSLIMGKDMDDFIFGSERGGKLTTRTAQKIFENALKNAEVKKDATFHSLRHSFATHLLENGVDVRYVQELLGHQNIRTTQRYTQVTNPKLKNIKSPL